MFTVIILSDAARTIFERNRVYFEPFKDAGLIEFCQWGQHPGATSLLDALPDLPEIIRGKREWRAIVVDHPRAFGEVMGTLDETTRRERLVSDVRDRENPFDFLDNRKTELNLEDSKHAIVRVSHILLGYPHLTAKRFEPLISYDDRDRDERVEEYQFDLVERWVREHPQERLAWLEKHGLPLDASLDDAARDHFFSRAVAALQTKYSNVRREFRSVPYTPKEMEIHRALTERYRMKEVRPSEVVFYSSRARMEEDESAELYRAWHVDTEPNASRFVERNDYPPMSRFAVYDLLERENSGYQQDELRFWLGVLCLAVNQLPSSGFQADRLYSASIDVSEERLIALLNDHLSRLATVRDHIERLISTPRKSTSLDIKDLLESEELQVRFDDLGGEDLILPTSGYGLSTDHPRPESRRWVEDTGRVEREANTFLRQPLRALRRTVADARELSHQGLPVQDELTEIERDELESELLKMEGDLIVPASAGVLEPSRLHALISRHKQAVRGHMGQRMPRATILASTAVALGVWILAFLPYLVGAVHKSGAALREGLVMLCVVVVLLSVAILVTLWLLRRILISQVNSFNSDLHSYVLDVKGTADVYGRYLSRFVSYMRGRRILLESNRALFMERTRLRRLREFNDRVKREIDIEKAVVLSLGGSVIVQRRDVDMANIDLDSAAARYVFQFRRGDSTIPFNSSGALIESPYDFITGFSLRRLVLFEMNDGAVRSPRFGASAGRSLESEGYTR